MIYSFKSWKEVDAYQNSVEVQYKVKEVGSQKNYVNRIFVMELNFSSLLQKLIKL